MKPKTGYTSTHVHNARADKSDMLRIKIGKRAITYERKLRSSINTLMKKCVNKIDKYRQDIHNWEQRGIDTFKELDTICNTHTKRRRS